MYSFYQIPKWLCRTMRSRSVNNVSKYLHRCAFNTICRNEKHNFLESSSMRDAGQVHARLFCSCRRIKWYVYIVLCEDDQPPRRSVIISRPTSTTRRRSVLFSETSYYNIIYYYSPAPVPARIVIAIL